MQKRDNDNDNLRLELSSHKKDIEISIVVHKDRLHDNSYNGTKTFYLNLSSYWQLVGV